MIGKEGFPITPFTMSLITQEYKNSSEMIPTLIFFAPFFGMYFSSITDNTSSFMPHKSIADNPPVKNCSFFCFNPTGNCRSMKLRLNIEVIIPLNSFAMAYSKSVSPNPPCLDFLSGIFE